MFLTKENGMRIVEEIKETIGRDVNIMDRTGTILASTDPKRIGQLHTIGQGIWSASSGAGGGRRRRRGPALRQGVICPSMWRETARGSSASPGRRMRCGTLAPSSKK